MEKNKLGVILFVISEANFFLMLILAYVYYHRESWVTADKFLEPGRTGINTIILLSSSLAIWLAERSFRKENEKGFHSWLFVTILLGVMFLFGQGIEWSGLINQGITISGGIFGTTFFTLTGFHGFHVFVGLVMLAILLGLAINGKIKGNKSRAVESVSLYWHFVDVVWIVVFTVVYLGVYL